MRGKSVTWQERLAQQCTDEEYNRFLRILDTPENSLTLSRNCGILDSQSIPPNKDQESFLNE
jgi:hypothetical protein